MALLPLHMGWIGVAIFFVVSGFCIHSSFQQQGKEWGSFFIRRFFRIYPAYLTALLLFLMVNPNNENGLWFQFKEHALLIHNYNSQAFYGINASFWTIAIEVQLYLLYPLLLMLVAKFGWKSTLVFLATGECFIHGWQAIYQTMLGISGYDYPVIFKRILPFYSCVDTPALATLCASPLAYWFSWSLGAAAADAYLKKQPMPLAKSPAWIWALLIIMAYFVRPLNPFLFLFAAVLTVALLSKYLSGERMDTQPPNFWLKQLRLTGIYSYSIYLLHQPLLEMFGRALSYLFSDTHPFFVFLCCVVFGVAVMALAALWYRLIELPGIALGKRIVNLTAVKVKEPVPQS